MKIRRQQQQGVAMLIVLFMISFLLIFVMANSKALFGLKREIKLVDQKQKMRWAESNSKTNHSPQAIKQEAKP